HPFTDTTFVVLACGSADGKHQVSFVRPSQAVRCHTKVPPIVYAVPTKNMKPLEEAYAKAQPGEAGKINTLLRTAPLCGPVSEKTLVEKEKNITLMTAHYSTDKSAAGCEMRKIGETVLQTPETMHPPPKPQPSALPSAAPSNEATTSGTASKGGC